MEPYYEESGISLHCGDSLTVLRTLPAESVHCCVTSPPYWGLRDYGVEGQLGLEPSPEAYTAKMVEVFREVRREQRVLDTSVTQPLQSTARTTSTKPWLRAGG